MPKATTLQERNAHPRDSRICFIEETHQYVLDGGVYTFPRSVSSFVAKFFSHFDSKGVIKKNIKKWKLVGDDEDISKRKYKLLFDVYRNFLPDSNEDDECEFLCKVWKTNGERQSSLGTAMHLAIETYLNELPVVIGVEVYEDKRNSSTDVSDNHEHIHQTEDGNDSSLVKEDDVCDCVVDDEDSTSLGVCLPPSVDYEFRKLLDVLVTHFSLWEEDAKRLLLLNKSNKYLQQRRILSSPEAVTEEMKAWKRWWETEKDDLVPFRTEWSVFSEDHDIAGQIDAMFIRKSRSCEQKSSFVLVDWKRVANMDYGCDSSSSPFLNYGKPPFQSIPDTNYGHYTIQVNTYKMILERFYGITISEMFLVQIHPTLPFPGYKIHPIKNI